MSDKNLGEEFRIEQREREAFYRNTRTPALFRDDAIRAWLEATDDAITALQEWRGTLHNWKNGRLHADSFDVALGRLKVAGLESWADQGPDLDALAEAVEGSKP